MVIVLLVKKGMRTVYNESKDIYNFKDLILDTKINSARSGNSQLKM